MIRSFIWVVLLSVLLPAGAVAGRVELVSVPAPPAPQVGAVGSPSWNRSGVSNDGRWVVFVSRATNLVPGQVDQTDRLGLTVDVFLRDRLTGTILLVSHSAAGPNVAATGNLPLISDDGTVVAFMSDKGNLVPGQPSADGDFNIYLYERATGNIQRATPLDLDFFGFHQFDLSADGRWLVHIINGSLGANHILLFDRFTGQNTLVDRSAVNPGQPSNGSSIGPRISADGRYIAFHSESSDILADQGGPGTFLYDRIEDTMTRVTNSQTEELRLSADGRWLAFLSKKTDLIPGLIDQNGTGYDIFLWDRITGALTLVSRSPSSPLTTATQPSSWSPDSPGSALLFSESVISADGRWIAFFSTAGDFAGEQTQSQDAFLFERVTGAVTRVSRTASSDVPLDSLALSEDGSRLAYVSDGSQEVPGQTDDGHAGPDTFVFDRVAGTRELASRSLSSDTQGTSTTYELPQVSADGRVVVFASWSKELVVENDLLNEYKVFAYVIPNRGKGFYTVTPCRLLDTRQAGPVLFSEIPRKVVATGSCGIPPTARALAANITILQSSGTGRLVAQPGDVSSEVSSLDFAAGETRAHHTTLGLAFDGSGTVSLTPAIAGGGTVHVLLDVFGYYE